MSTADIFQFYWSNTVTANSTVQVVAVTKPPATTEYTLMVTHTGSGIAYVMPGNNSSVSVTAQSGYPILPSSKEPLRVNSNTTHVAIMLSTGTGTIHLSTGRGE